MAIKKLKDLVIAALWVIAFLIMASALDMPF